LQGFTKHNRFNYQHYLKQVQRHEEPFNETFSKIIVIRTEHLNDDWRGLEEDFLKGPKDLNVTFTTNKNASPKRPEDLVLSEIARTRICHYLCEDIQVYKQLLLHAVNLNENDVAVSMRELNETCPTEAAASKCELAWRGRLAGLR